MRQPKLLDFQAHPAVSAEHEDIAAQFGVPGPSRLQRRHAQGAVAGTFEETDPAEALRHVALIAVDAVPGGLDRRSRRLQRGVDQDGMYAVVAGSRGGGLIQDKLGYRPAAPARDPHNRAEVAAVFESLTGHRFVVRGAGDVFREAALQRVRVMRRRRFADTDRPAAGVARPAVASVPASAELELIRAIRNRRKDG